MRLLKYALFDVCILFILILYPVKLQASGMTITNFPSETESSAESEAVVLFECGSCGDSYFRGVFFESGNDYFGFTQNNSGEWVGKENDRTKYFKVAKEEITNASFSAKIRVKPDVSDIYFKGPGDYFFKLGRYTSSGDTGAEWSNEVKVKITGPTKAPSPTAASTPTPEPRTIKTLTPQPSFRPTATTTLLPVKTVLQTMSPKTLVNQTQNKLAPTDTPIIVATSSPVVLGEDYDIKKTNPPLYAFLIIGLGIVFITIPPILIISKK